MYSLTQLTLSPADISKMKKRRKIPLWILGISSIVFNSIFFFAVDDKMSTILIVMMISSALMLIPMIWIYKRGQKDIDAGYKRCIKGEVDQKKIVSTGKSHIPYIFLGDEKVTVTHKEYKSISVGNKVEVHFPAKSNYALSFKRIG